jgi:hypothetical protein
MAYPDGTETYAERQARERKEGKGLGRGATKHEKEWAEKLKLEAEKKQPKPPQAAKKKVSMGGGMYGALADSLSRRIT